jgi:predicted outer membrane protein
MKKSIVVAAFLTSVALPAAAQMAPMAPMTAPMDRESFRQMALASDAFEMASSQLALERSRNPRVWAFAQQMLGDHAATSQALNAGQPVYGAGGQLIPGALGSTLAGAGIGALVGGPVGAAVGAGIGATAGTAAAAPSPTTAGGTAAGTLTGAGIGALAGGPVGAAVGAGVGAAAGATAGSAADVTGSISGAPIQTAIPLDARKSAMLNQLASATGSRFDRLYGDMQRQSHREAVALFSSYAQAGQDPAMVNFARQALPHLETHLAEARRLPGRR